MKKKFVIALFVLVIGCLFSFTVNAANEVTLTGGTTADFATVFTVKNNQVTGFNTGYGKDDVTDVTFPDEIVGIECNGLFKSAANLDTLTFGATDTFFISGDNVFSNCSVKTITFNPDCVVELRKGNFSGCSSLTEITFPKFKKLAGSAFKSCSNMVATNDLVLAEGMTDIGGHAFNGCTSLTGTVYFPSTLVTIQEFSFQNTGFTSFDLSKCASLTSVGGDYGGPFNNNDSITSLDLSKCVNLKELKNSFAEGCDNLTEVILPPNLNTIPSKAFAHCYKLQSIVCPASLTYIADEAFHSARKGQDIKTFTIYLQSNVQFGEKYPFRDSGAKVEYVLIGEGMTAQSFKNANTFKDIAEATVVDYLDPANPWTYAVGNNITAHTVVENYCKSLALSNEHSCSENPCVIVCDNCGLATAKENPEHSESVVVTYENGYNSTGVKLTVCVNKGCAHSKTEEMKALFVSLGYSLSKTGKPGLVLGYKVNTETVSEYESLTEKDVRYGVFAVSKDNLEDKDIFTNGEATEGVISAEIKTRHVVFELKITGFETDEQKAAELALGAYVAVTDDGVTEYSYIQTGEKAENEKYVFSSYNELLPTV